MSRTLPLLGKNHPLTGEPIRAIGFRPDGRPLWPIMGGDPSNDPPERPEDVSEEEWEALGDPGKQAIVRVRVERDQARSEKAEAERKLKAPHARPTPPKTEPPKPPKPPASTTTGDQPDLAALIKDAVDAAVKPFAEAEQRRADEAAASKVRTAVLDAAKAKMQDATDALQIDLASVLDDNGAADPSKVAKAIDDLLAAKPHLAKSDTRYAPPGIGGGAPAGGDTKDRVAGILSQMQRSTGVRVPTT